MQSVLFALAVAHGAQAGECRIESEHPNVHASMTRVSIDGSVYPVVGGGARFAFSSMLHDCDMDSAAYAFDEWRHQRRVTNTTAIVGGLTVLAGADRHPILSRVGR